MNNDTPRTLSKVALEIDTVLLIPSIISLSAKRQNTINFNK